MLYETNWNEKYLKMEDNIKHLVHLDLMFFRQHAKNRCKGTGVQNLKAHLNLSFSTPTKLFLKIDTSNLLAKKIKCQKSTWIMLISLYITNIFDHFFFFRISGFKIKIVITTIVK